MNGTRPLSASCAAAAVAVFLLGAAPSPGPVSGASSRLVARVAPVPVVGRPAPDFTLRDQNGARVVLSQTLGHKSVLVFYRGYW